MNSERNLTELDVAPNNSLEQHKVYIKIDNDGAAVFNFEASWKGGENDDPTLTILCHKTKRTVQCGNLAPDGREDFVIPLNKFSKDTSIKFIIRRKPEEAKMKFSATAIPVAWIDSFKRGETDTPQLGEHFILKQTSSSFNAEIQWPSPKLTFIQTATPTFTKSENGEVELKLGTGDKERYPMWVLWVLLKGENGALKLIDPLVGSGSED